MWNQAYARQWVRPTGMQPTPPPKTPRAGKAIEQALLPMTRAAARQHVTLFPFCFTPSQEALMPKARIAALAAVILPLLSTACSIKRLAVNQLGNALASGGSTFTSDDDPD